MKSNFPISKSKKIALCIFSWIYCIPNTYAGSVVVQPTYTLDVMWFLIGGVNIQWNRSATPVPVPGNVDTIELVCVSKDGSVEQNGTFGPSSNLPIGATNPWTPLSYNTSWTWADLAQQWEKQNATEKLAVECQSAGNYNCISMGYKDKSGKRFTLPGSTCGKVVIPEKPTQCDIVTGDTINFVFEPLQIDEVNGKEASSNLSIKCTATTNIHFLGKSEMIISGVQNVSADIYINNSNVITNPPSISVSANSTYNLPIKAILKTSGIPTTGDFSGSMVVQIAID
ncbi:MrpH family fimbial adhesin [Klebsiella oxytoca]|uniref:MrpH family fimbial adhesin n=1 Tax=Klebsiella oxytoca TaxID=571 RepID=UPI002248557B|nr:hypothetical protein [Klebsiella oxytoca]MCW9445976.1 hypothetical protein [Klebsiella oxytoca]